MLIKKNKFYFGSADEITSPPNFRFLHWNVLLLRYTNKLPTVDMPPGNKIQLLILDTEVLFRLIIT